MARLCSIAKQGRIRHPDGLRSAIRSFVLLDVGGVEGMCAIDGTISTIFRLWH